MEVEASDAGGPDPAWVWANVCVCVFISNKSLKNKDKQAERRL
jgi:hypothetical protein